MLSYIESVLTTLFLQGLFSGLFTLGKGAVSFTFAHPLLAGLVWFSLFCMTFMAYGTLRRMWEDGTFAALRMSQKVMLVVPLIVPFIFAYLFDILIMRCVYGWIRFGVTPWKYGGKPWGAGWTFSRLIWKLKDSNAEAQWWHGILHAIDPKGH
jgi:hypothetical protein